MRRIHIIIGTIALFIAIIISVSSPSLDDRKKRINEMDMILAPEALQRKITSQLILRDEGVPVNQALPVIATEQEITLRSKEQIAYRALSLLVIAAKGEGLEQTVIDNVVENYGLEKHFTQKEMAFIYNPSPSQHDRVQFTWRYEAAWTLLWALGYVEKLDKPTEICDVPRAIRFMMDRPVEQFLADAKLRPTHEILDQADRIYRYHWAVVDANLHGNDIPASLEPGVTMVRHYALNWLIGYMEQEWDDISTDT